MSFNSDKDHQEDVDERENLVHECGCVEFVVGAHWAWMACQEHGGGSGVYHG